MAGMQCISALHLDQRFHVEHSRRLFDRTRTLMFHVKHAPDGPGRTHRPWSQPTTRRPSHRRNEGRTADGPTNSEQRWGNPTPGNPLAGRADRLESSDPGNTRLRPRPTQQRKPVVRPSHPTVVAIRRRLTDEKGPAISNEAPAQLGGHPRATESAGHHHIATRPPAWVTRRNRRIRNDQLDSIVETEAMRPARHGVEPRPATVDQDHRSLRVIPGNHQPRHPAPRPDVDDQRRRGRDRPAEPASVFKDRRQGSGTQKAEALGCSQRLDQFVVVRRLDHRLFRRRRRLPRGRSRHAGTGRHPPSGWPHPRSWPPCRGSPCDQPTASARAPEPFRTPSPTRPAPS